MGRITRVNDKGDGDVSFDYDPAGNLTRVEYGARRKAITDYQYDLSGRMTGYKTSKLQGWKSDVVDGSAYAYDLFGDITSETKHDGAITIYQYDEADRLTRTLNAGNNLALKARDIQERVNLKLDVGNIAYPAVSGWSLPDSTSVAIESSYDTWFGTDALSHDTATEGPWYAETYAYDRRGRRSSKTNPLGSIGYQYSSQDRMTRAGNIAYTYDLDGNRTQSTATTEAWIDPETGLSVSSYQKGYWAGSSGSASFWGEDSQASTAPVAQSLPGPYACVIPGHGGDDGYHDDPADDNDDTDRSRYLESFTYRADNMLVGYQKNQEQAWTYTYDALTRRVAKERVKEHGRPAYETWQRDETTYLGLSDTILRASTEWKTWRTHVSQNALDYLVGPGGRAYGAEEAYWWRGCGYGNRGYAEDRFYHYDIRGSLSAITFDKPGLSGTRLEYDAFGNLEGGSFNASFQWQGLQHSVWETVGYAGQRYDRESGLYAYKYRSYDPEVGQWIQEDPIRAGEAWYEFCAGNPVRFTDPNGLRHECNKGEGGRTLRDLTDTILGGSTPTSDEHKVYWTGSSFTTYTVGHYHIDENKTLPYIKSISDRACTYGAISFRNEWKEDQIVPFDSAKDLRNSEYIDYYKDSANQNIDDPKTLYTYLSPGDVLIYEPDLDYLQRLGYITSPNDDPGYTGHTATIIDKGSDANGDYVITLEFHTQDETTLGWDKATVQKLYSDTLMNWEDCKLVGGAKWK